MKTIKQERFPINKFFLASSPFSDNSTHTVIFTQKSIHKIEINKDSGYTLTKAETAPDGLNLKTTEEPFTCRTFDEVMQKLGVNQPYGMYPVGRVYSFVKGWY